MIADRYGDGVAGEHLVHRLGGECPELLDAFAERPLRGGDVGETIDDRDDLELAVDGCRHASCDGYRVPRHRGSVHPYKRQGLQLRLQETVEGLSVIAMTYYGVGLASYLLKPLAKAAGVNDALVTMIAVPVIGM